MNTQLVFDTHTVNIITLTRTAVFINHKFGYYKQGDTLHPFRCIRGTSQNQMDNVVGVVVITPGNKDFLATQEIVITCGHCFCANCREIRTGLRLGEVHGSGPCA